MIILALKVLLPGFYLTPYNFTAFLNITVFPWYSVLIISLFLISVTGMSLHYGKNIIDEDSVFLIGLAGLVWVVKTSVFFYFDFYWIAVLVYVLVFFGFINRFIKKARNGTKTSVHIPLRENEFYCIIIAAVSSVFSVLMISTGYIYFWLALIVGLLFILFGNKNAVLWGRDAIFWQSLLLGIAGAAVMISFQNGFSINKIIIISAVFVFTSIILWMLNHKNNIGQNKFKAAKTAIVLIFALLVIIPAYKAGSHAKLEFTGDSVNIGALVKERSDIKITTSADGKDNAVTKLSYVWTNSFWYDKDFIIDLYNTETETETVLKIDGNHLILWTEDKNGVISRKDFWFYDSVRYDYDFYDVFRIGKSNDIK